jgi:hypothetical protein
MWLHARAGGSNQNHDVLFAEASVAVPEPNAFAILLAPDKVDVLSWSQSSMDRWNTFFGIPLSR